MKPIYEIRKYISQIPGAIYDLDPEEIHRGNEPGIQTLWEDHDSNIGASGKMNNDLTISDNNKIVSIDEIFEIGAEIDEDRIIEVMDGDNGERIKKSIEFKGTDGLAWYTTFHAKGGQWGIYIPILSILYLMTKVFDKLKTDQSTKFKIAFRALHQHELFHFAIDYISAQWEMITEKPCHKHARSLKDPELKYSILEEAMANANMIRSFWRGSAIRKVKGRTAALRKFTDLQPVGYSDGQNYTNKIKYFNYFEMLVGAWIGCIPDYELKYEHGVDFSFLNEISAQIDWRYCPIHILHNENRIKIPPIEIDLFRQVLKIRETDKFIKLLNRTPKNIQSTWGKVKTILSKTTMAAGLDFKFWERHGNECLYSIRVTKNYRAHLRYSRTTKIWSAIAIGNHKKMGHG